MRLAVLEPAISHYVLSSRLYCNPKALWKLNWFLRDFGYDTELLGRDEVDESQLVGLKGVVKISHIVFNGASLLRFDGFAPADRWDRTFPGESGQPTGSLMTYSYTQISQYLTCPRRYRHRYLDGWKEKEPARRCSSGAPSSEPWALFSAGRIGRRFVRGVVGMAKARSALLARRFLGSHAAAGHHALDSLLSGRSSPSATAETQPAD